jgi:hypothetical protein
MTCDSECRKSAEEAQARAESEESRLAAERYKGCDES